MKPTEPTHSSTIQHDEAARLAALGSYQIVGTPPEPAFDTIAALAAQAFGAPIALVSLVTADEQWFKANVGLPGITSTPRDLAFCTHALEEQQLLVVPDAMADTRFASNPLVTEAPHIRFYAGAPLITAQGHALGTLCAIDRVARTPTPAQLWQLQQLARVATALIEARVNTQALARFQADLESRERQLRTIADNVPALMGYVDSQENLQYLNQRALTHFQSSEPYQGRSLKGFLGDALYAKAGGAIRRALSGQRVAFRRTAMAGGVPHEHEVNYIPDIDRATVVRGFFVLTYDITESVRQADTLRISQQHLQNVFDAMAEGLVVQTGEGRIIEANRAAETVLGLTRDQLMGKSFLDPSCRAIREDGSPFPGEEHPGMVTLRTGKPLRQQIMGVRVASEEPRWISINSQPLKGAAPDTAAVITTFADVTEQKQLTLRLQQATTDLQAILDNVPARITSWFADRTNRFANRGFEQEFHLAHGEATGQHVREVVGAERYRHAEQFIDAALAGKHTTHEQADPQADGSIRYSQVSFVPMLRNGAVGGIYVLAVDITELRESRERIRQLALRLDRVREDERRQLALVLHEGLAQDLALASVRLARLERHLPAVAEAQQVCTELRSALKQCIEDIRDGANQLRPVAFDHLSLADSLRSLASAFGQATGIRIDVTEMDSLPKLNSDMGLLLFRAAQEALGNVAQHAHAAQAELVLLAGDDFVALEITDNGTGIPDGASEKPGSFGLLGMRERFVAVGGSMELRRNADSGTTVSVRIPLSACA